MSVARAATAAPRKQQTRLDQVLGLSAQLARHQLAETQMREAVGSNNQPLDDRWVLEWKDFKNRLPPKELQNELYPAHLPDTHGLGVLTNRGRQALKDYIATKDAEVERLQATLKALRRMVNDQPSGSSSGSSSGEKEVKPERVVPDMPPGTIVIQEYDPESDGVESEHESVLGNNEGGPSSPQSPTPRVTFRFNRNPNPNRDPRYPHTQYV